MSIPIRNEIRNCNIDRYDIIFITFIMTGVINLTNLPNQQVSGLNEEELKWVTNQSIDRYVVELDPTMFNELLEDYTNADQEEEEYKDLDDEVMREMDQAELEGIPSSTKFGTMQHVSKFKSFLLSKGLSQDIEEMPATFLNKYLRLFYFSLKCKDGSPYAPRSLIGIRAAIHRYLISPKVDRKINILIDREFNRANAMLKTMIGKSLRHGKKSKTFEAIEENDMKKIRSYFDRSSPVKLQQEIWFNIMYHFGFRGRETTSQLNLNSFTLQTDETGRRFIFVNHQTLSKNVKASLSQKEFEDVKNARMYDSPNPSECPVTAFMAYTSKCSPANDSLFPRPLKNWQKTNIWYSNQTKVGRDAIGEFMKDISSSAGLTKTYTNHCVRVTVVSELDAQGFSPAQIATVTGQKNSDSVNRYIRRRDAEKRKMSDALSNAMTSSITGDKKESNVRVIIRNDDASQRTIHVPQGSNINFHFDGQFKDCSFNFHS